LSNTSSRRARQSSATRTLPARRYRACRLPLDNFW
jgi:hypothetical protein